MADPHLEARRVADAKPVYKFTLWELSHMGDLCPGLVSNTIELDVLMVQETGKQTNWNQWLL